MTSQNKISNREKAALLLLAFGVLEDWTELFIVANDKSIKDIEKQRFLPSSVSRWRNSDKVQNQLKAFQKMIQEMKDDERQKALDSAQIQGTDTNAETQNKDTKTGGESERPETRNPRKLERAIDYSDPNARKALYNEIIQNATDDPKTQLDAAKLIEQTQKDDRQAAKEGKTIRVYLPLSCDICPLAQKARKKL